MWDPVTEMSKREIYNPTETSAPATLTPAATPIPIEEAEHNWGFDSQGFPILEETYSNPKYGLSASYPSNWDLKGWDLFELEIPFQPQIVLLVNLVISG